MAMGCHYDHIAVDWLPDSCIDQELVGEFDVSGPGADGSWPYFEMAEDNTGFVPINHTDIDAFAKTGRGYFATREWHIIHCIFTWRKQFRGRYDDRHIETWNSKEEHIVHCSDYIMETVRQGLGKDVVNTQILGVNRHPQEAQE